MGAITACTTSRPLASRLRFQGTEWARVRFPGDGMGAGTEAGCRAAPAGNRALSIPPLGRAGGSGIRVVSAGSRLRLLAINEEVANFGLLVCR